MYSITSHVIISIQALIIGQQMSEKHYSNNYNIYSNNYSNKDMNVAAKFCFGWKPPLYEEQTLQCFA